MVLGAFKNKFLDILRDATTVSSGRSGVPSLCDSVGGRPLLYDSHELPPPDNRSHVNSLDKDKQSTFLASETTLSHTANAPASSEKRTSGELYELPSEAKVQFCGQGAADMSSSIRSSRKRHGGFQPYNTLSNPSGVPSEITRERLKSAPLKEKNQSGYPFIWHPSRAKSEGRLSQNQQSFDYPAAKRRKTSSPEDNQDHLSIKRGHYQDAKFELSSSARHISSHARTPSDHSQIEDSFNGHIPSYRTVEQTMKPRPATLAEASMNYAEQASRRAVSHGIDNEGLEDDDFDFEMDGMCNTKMSANQTEDEMVHLYATKPVASIKNGRLRSASGVQKALDARSAKKSSPNMDRSTSKTFEGSSVHRFSSKGPIDPRPLNTGTTNVDRATTPSIGDQHSAKSSERKLAETFKRDTSVAKSRNSDDVDELQQTPPNAAIVQGPLTDLSVCIPESPQEHPMELNQDTTDAPRASAKSSKSETQHQEVDASGGEGVIIKKKKKKQSGQETGSRFLKQLEHLYIDSQDFYNVSIQYKELVRHFSIKDRHGDPLIVDGKELKIDVTEKGALSCVEIAKGDDAALVRLHRKDGKSTTYLKFTHHNDLAWFQSKVNHANRPARFEVRVINEEELQRDFESRHTTKNLSAKGERKLRKNLKDERGHIATPVLFDRGKTHSARRRSTRANGLEQQAAEVVHEKPPRFLRYCAALAKGKRWQKPLQYPSEATRGEIATVEPEELEHLEPEAFLNDSLVWFGIRYMLEKYPESRARVHCFNTYFYPSLSKNGKSKDIDYNAVKRWTSKQGVDIFNRDYVIVPINQELHWHLAIICNLQSIELQPIKGLEVSSQTNQNETKETSSMTESYSALSLSSKAQNRDDGPADRHPHLNALKDYNETSEASASDGKLTSLGKGKSSLAREDGSKKYGEDQMHLTSTAFSKMPIIMSLDSIGGKHSDVFRHLKDYLEEEAKEKHRAHIVEQPKSKTVKEIPKQDNFCDCGLFLIEYVKRFLEDPDTFVDKVLNSAMSMDYWPQTVADELRDNFREIVCEEGCKQNGIPPEQDPSESTMSGNGSISVTSIRRASDASEAQDQSNTLSKPGLAGVKRTEIRHGDSSNGNKSEIPESDASLDDADDDCKVIDTTIENSGKNAKAGPFESADLQRPMSGANRHSIPPRHESIEATDRPTTRRKKQLASEIIYEDMI